MILDAPPRSYEYIFKKRERNDRYHMNGATYGWSVGAMNAVKKLQKNAHKVDVYTCMQADNDMVVDNKGQDKFSKANKNVILIRSIQNMRFMVLITIQ